MYVYVYIYYTEKERETFYRWSNYYIKKSQTYLFISHFLFSWISRIPLSFASTRNRSVSQLRRNTMPFSVPFSVARITYLFVALRRGRRGFHVSGCGRSERRIRQLQQTRPSGGLQKVLHMPWGHRQGVRLPDRHRFQDRRRRRQRRLRGPRGCSRMVSIVFNTYTILSRSCRISNRAGTNKLRDCGTTKKFRKNGRRRVQ